MGRKIVKIKNKDLAKPAYVKLTQLSAQDFDEFSKKQAASPKNDTQAHVGRITRSRSRQLGLEIEKPAEHITKKRKRAIDEEVPERVATRITRGSSRQLVVESEEPIERSGKKMKLDCAISSSQNKMVIPTSNQAKVTTRSRARRLATAIEEPAQKLAGDFESTEPTTQPKPQRIVKPAEVTTRSRARRLATAIEEPAQNRAGGFESTEPLTQPNSQRIENSTSPPLDNQTNDSAMPLLIHNCDCSTIVRVEFKVDEIVWAKIKGYPHWPARIKAFSSGKMAVVKWFNDYRCTKLYRTQLFKFLTHYDQFSVRFKDTVGLECAAKEALITYGENMNANVFY